METILVRNLRTLDTQKFIGTTPEQAVIAAYAQSRGDYNTWNYAKYNTSVIQSSQSRTVACGDFCAFKVANPRRPIAVRNR